MRNIFQNNHSRIKKGLFVFVLVLVIFATPAAEVHAGWFDWLAAPFKCVADAVDCLVGGGVRLIAGFLNTVAGWMAELGAQFLDLAIEFTLNPANFRIPGVLMGWQIFRDLVNMAFIFVILYIAIMTILQLTNFNIRQTLARLIIVALLLNFSFFFVGFVIDIGNTIGTIIYDGITPGDTTIGQILTQRMNISEVLAADAGGTGGATNWQAAFAYVLNALFFLIAAFVFFAGGMLFIVRHITLLFLLMVAPLAFAAFILPNTQKHWSAWLQKLIDNVFVAPVFLLTIAVVIGIASAPQLLAQARASRPIITSGFFADSEFANAFLGMPGLLMNFIIIMGLMVAALTISKKFAGSTATMATGWAGSALGVGAGVGAFMGRRTIGRGLRAARDSKWLKDKASESKAWRAVQLTADKGARGSWDARGGYVGKTIGGTVGAALGAGDINVKTGKPGGKGGYDEIAKQQEKRKMRTAELLEYTPETTARLQEEARQRGAQRDAAHVGEHKQSEQRVEAAREKTDEVQERRREIGEQIKTVRAEKGDLVGAEEIQTLRAEEKNLGQQYQSLGKEIKKEVEYQKEINKKREDNQKATDKEVGTASKQAQMRYGEKLKERTIPEKFAATLGIGMLKSDRVRVGNKIIEEAKKTKAQQRADKIGKLADEYDDIEGLLSKSKEPETPAAPPTTPSGGT